MVGVSGTIYLQDSDVSYFLHYSEDTVFLGFFWLILVIFNLIFKNNHLTYLSGTFTISKKEKNLSNMKNFCWFSGFALHYESVESVEIWQGFALILGNKLHYFLSALLSKPQIYKISRKLNHGNFWTER